MQTLAIRTCLLLVFAAVVTWARFNEPSDRCCPDACCNGILFGGLTGNAPEFLPKDCNDIRELGGGKNGLYTIYPAQLNNCEGVRVYCDQSTDGGGWTVIQRRMNGWVDFYRDWDEYRNGFGFLTGEFWLGLEIIHHLSTQAPTELIIYMEDWIFEIADAHYWSFWVGDEASNYTLNAKKFDPGSVAGNGLDLMHNGMQFSTYDRDNDRFGGNCAVDYQGAWWYGNCLQSNLNGKYIRARTSFGQGLIWQPWRGYTYSLKTVAMMIRHRV